MIGLGLVVAGYFAGSIPFGVILTRKVKGVDVRASGSGNIGATNVARVAGKKLGAVVLLLDAGKGALAVAAAIWLAPEAPRLHAAVGLAAFLGHVFPLWLKLKGGKGVATAFGVLLVLTPLAAAAAFIVFAILFAIFRVSSVGSLVAGATVSVSSFFLARPIEYAVLATLLFVLMLFTHRGNIRRLIARTESRI